MIERKNAVFILLGQSNAVGHAIPMKEADITAEPLKNVFGLHREDNQSFNNQALKWRNYTSYGMNLAEEQDNTYSIANCLALLWQEHIDNGNLYGLPNLHIIQIAIGAQGVTEKYMWNPKREKKLIPGKLGTVDISLFSFSIHIFSLLDESFKNLDKEYEIIGLHWRGGESDLFEQKEYLAKHLEETYEEIFDEYNKLLHSPRWFFIKLYAMIWLMRRTPRVCVLKIWNILTNYLKGLQKNTKIYQYLMSEIFLSTFQTFEEMACLKTI